MHGTKHARRQPAAATAAKAVVEVGEEVVEKMRRSCAATCCCAALRCAAPAAPLLSAAAAADSTVYIIRHGEKTFSSGCLDIQGQERANNMPNVFGGVAFAAPSAIFANKYDGPPNCERCWLTVQTLAQHLSLRVEFDYGYPDALGGNEFWSSVAEV